jgi:DNA polymerase III alpha subunit
MFYFGTKLLPPHIIKSDMDFKIEGEDIRFGLLSIKGISDKSIEKLNNFKNS